MSQELDYGNPNKALYIKQVAAALGYIGLVNYNRVNVAAMADSIIAETGATARAATRRAADRLRRRSCSRTGRRTSPRRASASHWRIGRRASAWSCSDFFDKGGYENGLRYVAGGKYDLFCVQTLSPQEIEPDLQGDLKLRDMEDDDMAEVSITQPLIKQYKANLNAYCLALKDYVTRRGGTYLFTQHGRAVRYAGAELPARTGIAGMTIDMPHGINFFAGERTAQMSPDVFRIRLEQSGFAVTTVKSEADFVELITNDVLIRLFVESGNVVELSAETIFVNDRKTERLLELLGSMGWIAQRE